ncbi:RING finger protein 113A [Seminavis robusta]|uniref:RING finger protein 113A n=1 Tax=Seminavis robusta TaxID=568900 RepID=A0A9N8D483_9STRA|nr:RING finger protein 113A [Seminavis robusta]|eukprot:Sro1_g001040.1 RING finger protein 113A (316) ;mRNA; r:312581-313528
MFRKPKKAKNNRRRKEADVEEDDSHKKRKADDEEEDTSALLSEARKRTKTVGAGANKPSTKSDENQKVMHQYGTAGADHQQKKEELVTSTVQLHPEEIMRNNADGSTTTTTTNNEASRGDDGIFRDKTRSRLLAGPIKATGHIRTTCRFDYQPDICKDYKETGFCGFGDTCIYLHDRGDTLSGWQLEKQWEEEQKKKKEQQDKEIQGFVDANTSGGTGTSKTNDDDDKKTDKDGLPFACHICRKPFTNPVVTSCGHYFCEACIMDWVRTKSDACPVCNKDTHRVFNQATKLKSRSRRNKNKLQSTGGEFQEFLEG